MFVEKLISIFLKLVNREVRQKLVKQVDESEAKELTYEFQLIEGNSDYQFKRNPKNLCNFGDNLTKAKVLFTLILFSFKKVENIFTSACLIVFATSLDWSEKYVRASVLFYLGLLILKILSDSFKHFFIYLQQLRFIQQLNRGEVRVLKTQYELKQESNRAEGTNMFKLIDITDLHMGQLIILYQNQTSPADILILESSTQDILVSEEQLGCDKVKQKNPCSITYGRIYCISKVQPNISQKGRLFEYADTLNLTVKYTQGIDKSLKGFIKLKTNPNIEYFKGQNIIYKGEVLKSPLWLIGVVLLTGVDCKNFQRVPNFKKSGSIDITDRSISYIASIGVVILTISSYLLGNFHEKYKNISILNGLAYQLLSFLIVLPLGSGVIQNILSIIWVLVLQQQSQSRKLPTVNTPSGNMTFDVKNGSQAGLLNSQRQNSASWLQNVHRYIPIEEIQNIACSKNILMNQNLLFDQNKRSFKRLIIQNQSFLIDINSLREEFELQILPELKLNLQFKFETPCDEKNDNIEIPNLMKQSQNFLLRIQSNMKIEKIPLTDRLRNTDSFLVNDVDESFNDLKRTSAHIGGQQPRPNKTVLLQSGQRDPSNVGKMSKHGSLKSFKLKNRNQFNNNVNESFNNLSIMTPNNHQSILKKILGEYDGPFQKYFDQILEIFSCCHQLKSEIVKGRINTHSHSVYDNLQLTYLETFQWKLKCVSYPKLNESTNNGPSDLRQVQNFVQRYIIVETYLGEFKTFKILRIILPSPGRKGTLTVIVITPQEEIWVITRTTNFENLEDMFQSTVGLTDQIEGFSNQGYESLIYGYKIISSDKALLYCKQLDSYIYKDVPQEKKLLLKEIESDLDLSCVFGIQVEEQTYTKDILNLLRECRLSLSLVSHQPYESHLAQLNQIGVVNQLQSVFVINHSTHQLIKTQIKSILRKISQIFDQDGILPFDQIIASPQVTRQKRKSLVGFLESQKGRSQTLGGKSSTPQLKMGSFQISRMNMHLIIKGSSLSLINSNPYLLEHLLFICQFCTGLSFYEANKTNKQFIAQFQKKLSERYILVAEGASDIDFMRDATFTVQLLTQESLVFTYQFAALLFNNLAIFKKLMLVCQKLARDMMDDIGLYIFQKGLQYGILIIVINLIYDFDLIYQNMQGLYLQFIIITVTSILGYIMNKKIEYNKSIQKLQDDDVGILSDQPTSRHLRQTKTKFIILTKVILDVVLIFLLLTAGLNQGRLSFQFIFGLSCAVVDKIQNQFTFITRDWLYFINLLLLIFDIVLIFVSQDNNIPNNLILEISLQIFVDPEQLFLLLFMIAASIGINQLFITSFQLFSYKSIMNEATYYTIQQIKGILIMQEQTEKHQQVLKLKRVFEESDPDPVLMDGIISKNQGIFKEIYSSQIQNQINPFTIQFSNQAFNRKYILDQFKKQYKQLIWYYVVVFFLQLSILLAHLTYLVTNPTIIENWNIIYSLASICFFHFILLVIIFTNKGTMIIVSLIWAAFQLIFILLFLIMFFNSFYFTQQCYILLYIKLTTKCLRYIRFDFIIGYNAVLLLFLLILYASYTQIQDIEDTNKYFQQFGCFFIILTCYVVNMLITYHEQFYLEKIIYLNEHNQLQEDRKINDIMSLLMPKFVQESLQNGIKSLSKDQGNVCIMFCDICNYEELLQTLQSNIIQFLNTLFRIFDNMCQAEGVQKIETVGKTYMAACGLKDVPLPNDKFSSTQRILNLSASIMGFIQKNYQTACNGKPLIFKIGIHYGIVYAGVIGYHKPQFSLVGDTVNTTSRISSTGLDGMITMSEQAYKQIAQTTQYQFVQRQVEAKGKGMINTFVLQHKDLGFKRKYNQTMETSISTIPLNQAPNKILDGIRNLRRNAQKPASIANQKYSPKPDKIIQEKPQPVVQIQRRRQQSIFILSKKALSNERGSLLTPNNDLNSGFVQARQINHRKSAIHRDNSAIREFKDSSIHIIKEVKELKDDQSCSPFPIFQQPEKGNNDDSSNSSDDKSHTPHRRESWVMSKRKFSQPFINVDIDAIQSKTNLNFHIPEQQTQLHVMITHEQLTQHFKLKPSTKVKRSYTRNLIQRINPESQQHEFLVILRQIQNQTYVNYYYRGLLLFFATFLNTLLRWISKDQSQIFYPVFVIRLLYCVLLLSYLFIFKKIQNKFTNEFLLFYLVLYASGIISLGWEIIFSGQVWRTSIIILEILFVYRQLTQLFILSKKWIWFMSLIYLIFFFGSSIYRPIILYNIPIVFGIIYISIRGHSIIQLYYVEKYRSIENLDRQKQAQKEMLVYLLPSHIMEQFLNEPSQYHMLVDIYENCTVLFADIAGFTKYSGSVEPAQVVGMLRELFEDFDKSCLSKHNVYKLYTIGDCYVVIGVNNAHERDPVVEAQMVLEMGFQMIEIIQNVRERIGFDGLDMRIGIHTGTVIGGVIGTDLIRYDIYGNDVTIANKMESNSYEGQVLISQTTKDLLATACADLYDFEYHKDVKAPGDRTIKSYFVYPTLSHQFFEQA